MTIVSSIEHCYMAPQSSKSLKCWANDEPGCMTGLFYSTKILLKI